MMTTKTLKQPQIIKLGCVHLIADAGREINFVWLHKNQFLKQAFPREVSEMKISHEGCVTSPKNDVAFMFTLTVATYSKSIPRP